MFKTLDIAKRLLNDIINL